MVSLLIIVALICCVGVSFKSFNTEYLSIHNTSQIRGVFAILILLSHMKGYLALNTGLFDKSFDFFFVMMGQLLVAVYFFYSGYGTMESYKHKKNYLSGYLKKRFGKTLLHFDLAIILYIILQSFLGQSFQVGHLLLSFIGWTSIGNSNWFMFDIFSLYLITYFVLYAKERFHLSDGQFLTLIIISTVVLWSILFGCKRGDYWWYNTIIAYPLGFAFSIKKQSIDKFLNQSGLIHVLLCVIFSLLFIFWRLIIGFDPEGICTVLFIVALTLFFTFITMENGLLVWIGKHAFHLYILQRIPMIMLSSMGINDNKWLFSVLVIFAAFILAWLFEKVTSVVDFRLGLTN